MPAATEVGLISVRMNKVAVTPPINMRTKKRKM